MYWARFPTLTLTLILAPTLALALTRYALAFGLVVGGLVCYHWRPRREMCGPLSEPLNSPSAQDGAQDGGMDGGLEGGGLGGGGGTREGPRVPRRSFDVDLDQRTASEFAPGPCPCTM